jgi:hypothetical protein
MVSPQQEKISRIFDLVGHQQADDFEREFSTINIISKEEIVRLRGVFAVVK